MKDLIAICGLNCETIGNVHKSDPQAKARLKEERKKSVIETQRLLLREMTEDDFEALYKVLSDSDIRQHYPYTFDEARVRGWIRGNMETIPQCPMGADRWTNTRRRRARSQVCMRYQGRNGIGCSSRMLRKRNEETSEEGSSQRE